MAPSKGQGRLTGALDDSLPALHAFLEAHGGAFRDHDRVIHDLAQYNDERAKRHALKIDAPDRHHHESAENGEHQRRANHQRDAPAQDERHDDKHEQHRLIKFGEKSCHRVGNVIRLPVHAVHLDAYRKFSRQFRQAALHRPSNGNHIGPRDIGDRNGERRFAVVAHHRARRVNMAATDGADVPDANQLIAVGRLGLGRAILQPLGDGRAEHKIGDVGGD